MKRKPTDIMALTRKMAVLDEQHINELYGLEPVYEPLHEGVGSEPSDFVTVVCPYCGELFDTRIDVSAGASTYIEDCQVCCQPIELQVKVNDAGQLLDVSANRLDD